MSRKTSKLGLLVWVEGSRGGDRDGERLFSTRLTDLGGPEEGLKTHPGPGRVGRRTWVGVRVDSWFRESYGPGGRGPTRPRMEPQLEGPLESLRDFGEFLEEVGQTPFEVAS